MRQLETILAHRTVPLQLFFRNDDAGWEMDKLDRLLDLFAAAEIPIDLAAIPAALSRASARRLDQWREQYRGIGIHQHGYAHLNHEPEGARKCEFGASRPVERQCADILIGRERLVSMLGPTDPIFTPPWNRCSEATINRLSAMGFAAYSADKAPQDPNPELCALPVCLDWARASSNATLAAALANTLKDGNLRTGIMLHHAIMDDESRTRLGIFLSICKQSDMVRCLPMHRLLEQEP